MAVDPGTEVHEQAEAQERHAHNFAMGGIAEDIGLIAKSHDQAENNPNSEKSKEKKRLRDEFATATLQAVIEAQNRLMERLNQELEALSEGLDLLEKEMAENRADWEKNGEVLNDISDLLSDFVDGGELDREQTDLILIGSGLPSDALRDLSDAETITLIEQVRLQALENNEALDTRFGQLEQDHIRFKERENEVLEAQQRLERITADPNMSDDQKLQAIHELDNEIGSKTLHATATATHNQEARDMADSVTHEVIQADTRQSVNLYIPGM